MAIQAGTTLGTFEILALLGVGGMGEVYRARDSRLHREVAIKVLPESVASDHDRLARFEREARTLASLDHPNIAALYDFQESGGNHFLVMQLVEGGTLADRLAGGPLSPADALGLFVDIADGLAAAHERGIIHRDLKPANLKIDPRGRIRILDFGLAKAFETETESNPTGTLAMGDPAHGKTSEGQILGTPAYMSPEQARGQAIDKRADIWAFGVCLYEALSGQRPFHGETATDLLADILRGEPDWAVLPAGLPRHLKSLIRRCLEKNARRRFSSIGDIAITLEETAEDLKRSAAAEAPTVPPRPAPFSNQPGGGGFTPPSPAPPSPSPAPPSPTPSASSPEAYSPRGFMPPTPTPSSQIARRIDRIVVLPFDNLMGDPNQEHFVDGMTESLSIELSKMTGVEVISHITAMHYKGTNKLPRQIARELGVDGLLGGAIMRGGDDVRITVRLIDGKTDRQVWADQYDGKHAQILSLQKQAALAVAEQISTSLTLEDRMKTINVADVNPEAHNEYLLGRHFASRQSRESLQIAHKHYRKALALDPDFALAHAGMAEGFIAAGAYGIMRAGRAFSQAREYAIRATQLDASLGFAYALQAHALMFIDQNWTECTRLVDQALRLSPRDPAVIEIHGHLQSLLGNHVEARKASEVACELDPLNALAWGQRARTHFLARDHEGALRYLEHSLALEPNLINSLNARTYTLLALKRFDEAVAAGEYVVRVYPDDLSGIANLPLVYAWAGREEDALEALKRIKHAHSTRALVYTALGDHKTALDEFETSLKEVDWPALISSVSPLWDPLRSYPRFRKVLQRLGYPDDIDRHLLPPDTPSPASSSVASASGSLSDISTPASSNRLVVLPFENLMGDPNQEHFVDGMTEALSIELSKMTGVEVISHTSAMHFKGTNTAHREIASQLGVGRLVAGSIMRAGDDIRITVRLIDGRSERQLWGDKYEGKHAKILSLQGEVALAVAEQVSSELTAQDRANAINAPAVNPEAHEACLLGFHMGARATRESLAASRKQFERAIAIDPGYVPAHAGLARMWVMSGVMGTVRGSIAFAEGYRCAERAVELDPSSAEALVALGNATLYAKRDWDRAERLIRQSLELNPRDSIAHSFLGILLTTVGRFPEAYTALARACELDPLNASLRINRAMSHYLGRDYEVALRHVEQALKLEPTQISGMNCRIWILLMLDRSDEALSVTNEVMRLYPNDWSARVNAARVYAASGRPDEAHKIIAPISRPSSSKAEVLLDMGEPEAALAELEGAVEDIDWLMLTCGYGPVWDPIRRDPRFRAVRRRIGFTNDDDLDLLPGKANETSSTPSSASPHLPAAEGRPSDAGLNRIAVLPFENLMGDAAQEHFVFGMSDALSIELARVPGFEVIAHNSSMLYKDSDKPPRRIAMELGVNRLLGGAVMRAGDDVRISIRLIDGRTEQQLWAEKYEGKQADILSLQAEAALAVAEQLASSISPQQRMRTLNAGSVKPEAHEAYLLGLHFAHHRNAEELLKALDQYRRAIELDPTYEPPYRELAQNMMVIGYLGGMDPHEAFARCREYATSLRSLNPESPEARFLLGACRILIEKEWEAGMREVRAATNVSSENSFLQRNLGVFEMVLGRIDDASRALENACGIDPLAPANWTLRGMACHFDHRFEDALSFFRHARFVAPDYRHVYQQEIQLLTHLGRTAEARRLLDHLRTLSVKKATMAEAEALCLAADGKESEAREVITRWEENHDPAELIPFNGAHIYLALGDEETALARLEETAGVPGLWSMMAGYFPLFDPLRRLPRFRALRRSVGFTDDGDLERLPPESKPASDLSISTRPDSTPSSSSSIGRIEKLAVLPFTSIAKDDSEDWLVDGVTESLITELGKIRSLDVISRSTAMRFKNSELSAPEIAQELQVDALVEGSVQRVGDEIRIQAHLIDPAADRQLWSDDYDGSMKGILKLQKEVALSIAREVKATISPSEARRIRKAHEVKPEAYELFLKAKHFYSRADIEGFERSLQLASEAVRLDPEFAAGHAFVAQACVAIGNMFGNIADMADEIVRSASRALELDPDDAMAHNVRAWQALTIDRDWNLTEREFRRAIELNPGLPEPHNGLAWYFQLLGRFEDAIHHRRQALRLDPLNTFWRVWLAWDLLLQNRPEHSLAECREILELDPENFSVNTLMPLTLGCLGRAGEAFEGLEAALSRFGRNALLLAARCELLVMLGRRDEAAEITRELSERSGNERIALLSFVRAHIATGSPEERFSWFERGLRINTMCSMMIHQHWTPSISDHPRFHALLDELGYPGLRPEPPASSTPDSPSTVKPAPDPGTQNVSSASGSPIPSLPDSQTSSDDGSPRYRKLAVLPFTSIAKDASEDWFTDGMTELLITELGKIKSLTVISRTSAMRYKDTDKPLTEIASELNVNALVEGSIIRMGNDVQITARLIDGQTDERLWGDFFAGKFEDILKLQGEVTLAIAREIKVTVSPEEAEAVAKKGKVQVAAYEECLRGRMYQIEANRQALQRAVMAFERAIELDPDFAPAYAGLSSVISDQLGWFVEPASVGSRALEAAERALELDPKCSEAHLALATIYRNTGWDWTAIEQEYKKALELDPGNSFAHMHFSWFLGPLGRIDEAILHCQRAIELDPVSPVHLWSLAFIHFFDRDFEKSLDLARRALEIDSNNIPALTLLGACLIYTGKIEDAQPCFSRALHLTGSDASPWILLYAATGYHRIGKHEIVQEILQRLIQLSEEGYRCESSVAMLYAELGELDEGVAWYLRAIEKKDWPATWVRTFIFWDPLKNDARFGQLVESIGLPELKSNDSSPPAGES